MRNALNPLSGRIPAAPLAGVVARGHAVGRGEALTHVSRADRGLANGSGELCIEFRVVKEQLHPPIHLLGGAMCTMIKQATLWSHPGCIGYRSPWGRKPQKSRIGSMRSAKINTTPEIKITPPTTYATGSNLAVSTGPGSGRPKRRAMARLTAS
jgi:hypothetical protein